MEAKTRLRVITISSRCIDVWQIDRIDCGNAVAKAYYRRKTLVMLRG